jgi:chromosome partitioning protein
VFRRFKGLNPEMGFAENLGVIINMKDAQSSVEADYQRWLNENADNKLFAQTVPRTSALQHASHLSPVERSYMAKYPGESSVAIRAVCQELLARLDAANAKEASVSAASSPPVGSEASS